MWRYSSVLMLAALGLAIAEPEMTPEQRREYRDKLMQILPEVPGGRDGQQSFAEWVKATDALPPDFDALPKVNGLPDPFTFLDGKRKVRTQSDWKARRAEIRQLFEIYVIGSLPPKPRLDKIVPVDPAEAARGAHCGAMMAPPAAAAAGRRGFTPAEGSVTRMVDLRYGPDSQISTRVTLTIPPGAGPFPVLIGGGPNVTSYGYIACQFPSSVDAPPDIGRFYPGYDWASMAKVAWTVPMVVDYLYTLPEVDKPHIAITGYSRLGKMAAYAAAIGERIAACIAGSTGVGGVLTWRHGSERNIGESYPLGYMWVYREVVHPILAVAHAGYAVLAFDQTGYGSRMNEAAPFYDRSPHWSQLGRMVEDVRAAVDALQKDARIDPDKIYLFGYGVGGMVALHAAALDPRIKGVVSICGFMPMRTDTADRNTGGIRRFSHERALLPRLGAFSGQEARIPYDYQDLIGAIAPRPAYVFNPIYNRDATVKDVRDAVAQARKVYGLYHAADKLVLDDPWDHFRLSSAAQERIVQWMSETLR